MKKKYGGGHSSHSGGGKPKGTTGHKAPHKVNESASEGTTKFTDPYPSGMR